MQVNSVRFQSPKLVSFKGTENKQGYENPIDRKTERNLAVLGSVGTSLLAGTTAFGITTCLKDGRKVPGIIGAIAAGVALVLTLPSALYNTKVGSFKRKEEMDVFSREKAAEKTVLEGINREESLEDQVSHLTSVLMAKNGHGMMVKGA